MAFSDEDLQSLTEDFAAGRPTEREFYDFRRLVRAPEESEPVVRSAPRKCARCQEFVHDGGRLCLRHKEQHRQWALQRVRKRGGREWRPGEKGRPPNIVRGTDAEVMLQSAMLNDAFAELTALKNRIAYLKSELTKARKAARVRSRQFAVAD